MQEKKLLTRSRDSQKTVVPHAYKFNYTCCYAIFLEGQKKICHPTLTFGQRDVGLRKNGTKNLTRISRRERFRYESVREIMDFKGTVGHDIS